MSTTAAILIIGDEILSGKVQDANSPFLARELRELGVALERIVVIPDRLDTIATFARELADSYDVLFTSGGVGPTHDDMTIAGIAQGLGRKVVRHPELEGIISRWFAGAPNEAALKMAEIVEGGRLHYHDSIKFPVMQVENIFIFPGIPEILQRNFAAIREMFRADAYHLRVFYLATFESELAATLHDLLADYPGIACGSYPVMHNPDWHVRVTLESKDPAYLDTAVESLRTRLDPTIIYAIE